MRANDKDKTGHKSSDCLYNTEPSLKKDRWTDTTHCKHGDQFAATYLGGTYSHANIEIRYSVMFASNDSILIFPLT